jgi:hypothetical protein
MLADILKAPCEGKGAGPKPRVASSELREVGLDGGEGFGGGFLKGLGHFRRSISCFDGGIKASLSRQRKRN